MLSFSSSLVLLAASFAASALGCQDGYEPWFDGYCFKLNPSVTLAAAMLQCRYSGGELASIHSKEEAAAMVTLAKANAAWIGLRCNESIGAYYWMDGSAVDFLGTDEKCTDDELGYILGTNGKWIGEQIGNYYISICKHKRRNNVVCDDYDVVDGSGTCVSLKPSLTSWHGAEAACTQDDAHLVSIHDKNADDYIAKKAFAAGFTSGVHIGLQTNSSQNDERWSDGSPVNYTNFARGFPMDLFGHCTSMETNALGGQWMSNHCDGSFLPYACGRPAYDVNHPISPATCPENPYYTNETTIYSPSYPGNSGVISCEYFLAAPEGRRAKVVFDDFEANKCCDTLEIHDGAFGGSLIATLTGQPDGIQIYTSSSSNILRLAYNTTDGKNVRGWRARFTIV